MNCPLSAPQRGLQGSRAASTFSCCRRLAAARRRQGPVVQQRAPLQSPQDQKHQVVAQSDASASGMYTDKPVPNAFWRAFSAFLYVVPILDTWRLGVRNYDVLFPTIAIRNFAVQFSSIYQAHQLVPLVVFFLMFLALIKNKRLHHFVRFNAMQAMMLDIMVMLPVITRNYIPGEIYWTAIGKFMAGTCFVTFFIGLLYSVYNTLCGRYADLPYVSDAVYMQVWQMEML